MSSPYVISKFSMLTVGQHIFLITVHVNDSEATQKSQLSNRKKSYISLYLMSIPKICTFFLLSNECAVCTAIYMYSRQSVLQKGLYWLTLTQPKKNCLTSKTLVFLVVTKNPRIIPNNDMQKRENAN